MAIPYNKPLWLLDPLFLDTETTGVNGEAEVISLTIANSQENILLSTFIKPVVPIDTESQSYAVNGITQDMVEDAPSFVEVWENAKPLLEGRIIVCFNSDFDSRLLRQSCARACVEPVQAEWFCAMTSVGKTDGRWIKLEKACNLFGVICNPDHTSAGDTIALVRLVQAWNTEGGSVIRCQTK